MNLKKGYYTINNSSVMVWVLEVIAQSDKFAKVRTMIIDKKYNRAIEGLRVYKLTKEKIEHWRRV